MIEVAKRLKAYIDTHPFDPGDSDCETVLDQLYQAYAESHESEPAVISDGFKELEDNNAVFNLCCCLCSAYERKAFIDGLQYGAHLIMELQNQFFARRGISCDFSHTISAKKFLLSYCISYIIRLSK